MGDLGTSKVDNGEDTIDAKDVLLGDHIVGTDKVTYDANGPGALEVASLKAPNDLTPAQWANIVSHTYRIILDVAYAGHANVQMFDISNHTNKIELFLCWSVIMDLSATPGMKTLQPC